MLDSVKNFIAYWYFRYLLVTELYMVEKWERVTIHVFFSILFAALSYFNNTVFLKMTSRMFGLTPIYDEIIPIAS